jgi:hypothetical protein
MLAQFIPLGISTFADRGSGQVGGPGMDRDGDYAVYPRASRMLTSSELPKLDQKTPLPERQAPGMIGKVGWVSMTLRQVAALKSLYLTAYSYPVGRTKSVCDD